MTVNKARMFQGILTSVVGGDLPVGRAKVMILMLGPTRRDLDDALRTFPLIYRSRLRGLFDGLLPQSHQAPSLQERGLKPPLLRVMRGGTRCRASIG